MIDLYYFESTLKTNRFDCNWGMRQKRYKDTTLSEPGILTWFLEGWHRITTNWSTNWTQRG